jgi:hypothetical protein
MTSLYIEPEAEAELEQASLRYEGSVPGLGNRFLAEVVGDTVPVAVHVPAFMHPRQRPSYWSHRRARA